MPRAIALSRLVPLTVALAATGCMYHVHVLRIDPAPRPRRDERLSRRLVKEAAKLGGDAVLLGSESFGSAGEQRKLTAKVIVFDREARATGNR